MKVCYFDCFAGVSGDMILGALVDAGLPIRVLEKDLSKLNLKGYKLSKRLVKKNGFRGCQIEVKISKRNKSPRTFHEIESKISSSRLPSFIRQKSLKVFKRLGQAEAKVHRTSLKKMHWHEMGVVDTLVDVVGSVIGFYRLDIEKVLHSPINTGQGKIKLKIEEGENSRKTDVSVPPPATAEMLKGVPFFSSDTPLELATPTGVAILTALGQPALRMPFLIPTAVGYGAGQMNPSTHPNLLRVFVGNEYPVAAYSDEQLVLMQTNIDDLNPQIYEYLMEQLLGNGARDVYLTPVIMKKGRPATVVSVLTDPGKVAGHLDILFRETTTLGVRIQPVSRVTLNRKKKIYPTPFGNLPGKAIYKNGEIHRIFPEYDACKRIARKTGLPLRDVLHQASLSPSKKRR